MTSDRVRRARLAVPPRATARLADRSRYWGDSDLIFDPAGVDYISAQLLTHFQLDSWTNHVYPIIRIYGCILTRRPSWIVCHHSPTQGAAASFYYSIVTS